ncbi:MAG: Nramp family divalent metal transporter [bacterium]|jgi:manganese transport protein
MTTTAKSHDLSLSEVHSTVKIPAFGSWWRRLFAFMGPAYLVSVGYMDPGNWATDLEGGARFGYQLIWVLLMSNLMAVLLQTLCARMGIAGRRDLAQACRESYPPIVNIPLWILCELAIAACDLAEVLGTAIGLNLLFGMPLIWGIAITVADTLLILLLQHWGIRKLEAFILSLVFIVGASFFVEMLLSPPVMGDLIAGFIPSIDGDSLYVALGMLGATVMPHNLYLHSALVQSRAVERTDEGKRAAMRFNLIDTVIALNAAFFVNAAILTLAASVFHARGIEVTEIQQAHELLAPLVGTTLASTLFAVALLAAGQSSTLTGTLAGQIVLEGFVRVKMQPWARRLVSRMIAVVPAVIVVGISGSEGTYKLLILSQVILSLQLPFAIVPLIDFTSDKRRMGKFANPVWVNVLAWACAFVIIGLNMWLAYQVINEWRKAGPWVDFVVVPLAIGLVILLGFVTFRALLRRLFETKAQKPASLDLAKLPASPKYKKIGVALEVKESDIKIMEKAAPIASQCGAELILIHIVESATAQVYEGYAEDREAIEDEEYLKNLVQQLEASGRAARYRLGFGNAAKGVVKIATEEKLDLLVLGSHGHRAVQDWIFGSTVAVVQHEIGDIPILVVKGT